MALYLIFHFLGFPLPDLSMFTPCWTTCALNLVIYFHFSSTSNFNVSFFLFSRNVGKEYSFVCSSKLVSENKWIPKRICCYVSSSTNSSRCRKFTNMAYPMSPIIRKRSHWRSFAASLNLEDGPAPSDSTSSSSDQTTDADGTTNGDVSENLLSRKLSSDEVSVELSTILFSLCSTSLDD
jgi:hypothetical protein